MNIDKEREAFENLWLAGGGNFDNFIFSEDQGKYAAIENSNLTDKQKEMALYVVNNAYLFFVGGFKQAAQAQAVPEGFVLVPKEPNEEQYGGLARHLGRYMQYHNRYCPKTLKKYFDGFIGEPPEWLSKEVVNWESDHAFATADLPVFIYKAMINDYGIKNDH